MATKQRSKRHAQPAKTATPAPKRQRPGLGALGAGLAGLAAVAAIVFAVLISLGVLGGGSSSSDAERKFKSGQPIGPDDVAAEVQAGWKASFAAEHKTWAPAVIAGQPTGDDPCQSPVAVYCDSNHTVYLDPDFMKSLEQRAGPRDAQLAQAFVVAHLLGHHVQNQLGITEKVTKGQDVRPNQAVKIAKARELEADCLAGFGLQGLVSDGIISTQGIERAMTAAAETGQSLATDDPTDLNQETWHSTALANRVKWFQRGLQIANVGACDTFGPLV